MSVCFYGLQLFLLFSSGPDIFPSGVSEDQTKEASRSVRRNISIICPDSQLLYIVPSVFEMCKYAMAKKLSCAKIELINHFIRPWMLLLPVSGCERLTSNVKDKDKNMTVTKKRERNSPTTRQFALKGSCLVLFLPLAFCSVVMTHVISVHRYRKKDRASGPITSMKSTSRQTDLCLQNKHFRQRLFIWRAALGPAMK